jgi:hypothetical protein
MSGAGCDMARIAPFSEIDMVITDTSLPAAVHERPRWIGCELRLA